MTTRRFSLAVAAASSALAFGPISGAKAQLSRTDIVMTTITIRSQPQIVQRLPFLVQNCPGLVAC